MRRMMSFARGYLDVLLAMVIAMALVVGPGIRAADGATAAGTWTIVPSPNVGASSELRDVATSGGAAWAVGWGQPEGTMHALIESWDGSAWTVAMLPDLPGESALYGVDSLPSGEAWAVGRVGTRTLILRWQGSSWQVVPSPNVPKVANRLYGVSAAASSDAWAVGKAGRGVVIEHWNGHTWRLVDHPSLHTPAVLTSVVDVPGGPVWVVGAQSHPGWANMNAMSMRWTGTRWVVVPVPLPKTDWPLADQLSQLEHVTLAGNQVWTAGWYWNDSGSSRLRGIIRHWADGAWQRVAVPDPSAAYSMLFGIGGELWAVGIADDETYAVLETEEGWQVVDTPNALPRDPGMNHNFLLAVDSSTGVSWAVGYSEAQGEGRQTMVMRYQA